MLGDFLLHPVSLLSRLSCLRRAHIRNTLRARAIMYGNILEQTDRQTDGQTDRHRARDDSCSQAFKVVRILL